MKNKFKFMLLIPVLLVGLVVLVACNGDDDTDGTSDNGGNGTDNGEVVSTGETSQGITDDEILVGTTFVTSGAAAFIGVPIVDTFEAVINRVNEHGGIGGRQINLLAYDDGGDPAEGHVLLERLLEEHEVFALMGISGGSAPMSLGYMREFGAPVINITGGVGFMYEEYDPGSNIFLIQPSNAVDGPTLLARVIATPVFGENRDEYLADDAMIGVMVNATEAGDDITRGLEALAAELGISDRLMIEVVTADIYPTVIQQMMSNDVGVLINGTLDSMGIIAAMSDAGWYVPVFGAYGTSTVASYSPYTYDPRRPHFATIWAEDVSEQAIAMLDDMRDALNYHPGLDDETRDAYVDNGFARAGYITAIVLVHGLERLEASGMDWTWDNFIIAMESEPFNVGGVPEFSFADGRRMGVETMALWEYTAEQDASGEWEVSQAIVSGFMSIEEILESWHARQ